MMKNNETALNQPVTIGLLASTISAEEVSSWPEHSKNAVLEAIAAHGIPDIISAEVLVWKNGCNTIVVEKHHGSINKGSQY